MKKTEKVDVILVLGHMIKDKSKLPIILESRIRKAEEIYNKLKCKVIFSGGKRKNINEAHFMKEHTNIPKKMILLEDKSTNTKTNALFCKKIILNNNFESIFVVTSDYHIFRAFIVFKNIFPNKIKIKMISAVSPIKISTRIALFFIEIFKMFKDLNDIDLNHNYRRTDHTSKDIKRP